MDLKETGYEILVWNRLAQDQVGLVAFEMLAAARNIKKNTHTQTMCF